MSKYSLSHLSDGALLQGLAAAAAHERNGTASLLAHLAEVDARKLYLAAAYPTLHAYCVGELGLWPQAAYKRIEAARAAVRFPAIFVAVAEGRLHLSAVVMLASKLTPENAEDLLAAAAGNSKADLERLLAERFPRPDVPAQLRPIADQLSPGITELSMSLSSCQPCDQVQLSPGTVESRGKMTPLTPGRHALQCTISRSARENLEYGLMLTGHQVAPGDLPTAIERAAAAWVRELEKQKFAKTSRPRASERGTRLSTRHIPAEIKRRVWERDHGQCTFVSEAGKRCPARSRLEFDHIDPVARGGRATLDGMRLRCRAHNQYAAECAFGTEFMRHKREEAQHASAAVRAAKAETASARATEEDDVTGCLRSLGFRGERVRLAVEHSNTNPDASLEERVKLALSYLGGPHYRAAMT